MFIAINKKGERVYSDDANRQEEYFCPICNGKVIYKSGDLRCPHFAHESNECYDDRDYDMSEWHKKMQEYFDEEYREVVCTDGKTKHRADILKDGVVLEFQHSSITSKEFLDRNEFYMACGYKVMRVFDVSEEFENEYISFFESSNGNELVRWKYPKQILKYSPEIGYKSKNFALFLCWDHGEDEIIEKVTWSSKDDDGYFDFKRIALSDYCELERNMNLDQFFENTKDRLFKYLKNKQPFLIKKIGAKGFKRDSYICPKRNEFGLKAFSEKGCSYCEHCLALEEIGCNRYGRNYNVYCSFPNKTNKKNDSKYYEAPIF